MQYSKQTWLNAYSELLTVLEEFGIPEEVGKMLAKQIGSEKGMRRMTAYMYAAKPKSMEQIVDEALAISEDAQAWRRKKQAEESGARYNAWLSSDMREE